MANFRLTSAISVLEDRQLGAHSSSSATSILLEFRLFRAFFWKLIRKKIPLRRRSHLLGGGNSYKCVLLRVDKLLESIPLRWRRGDIIGVLALSSIFLEVDTQEDSVQNDIVFPWGGGIHMNASYASFVAMNY